MRPRVVMVALVALALSACAAQAPAGPGTAGGAPRLPVTQREWSYSGSYGVPLPADPAPLPTAVCTPDLAPGWLARENSRPGTTLWRGSPSRGTPQVEIYLDRPSTQCGERVGVHLGGRGAQHVVLRAFRVGWYAGAGARLVFKSAAVDVPATATATLHGRTVGSPRWTTTLSLPVGASWPTGLYLVQAFVGGRASGEAPLVVRDPTPRTGVSAGGAVVMYSNLTWSAYSTAGGASLYRGRDGTSASRALDVAVARPLLFPGRDPLLTYDVPTAQLLDRAGVAADPVVDTDVDRWPSLLDRTEVVLPGHSEYWTASMFDALTAARDAGANIADLGANDVYWHARVSYAPDGAPVSVFVAKQLALDPLARSAPSAATVEWRQKPLWRNPSAVLGQSYTAVDAKGGLVVRSVPDWLSGVPGLVPGALLPRAAWNEVNGIRPAHYPVPSNVQLLTQGVLLRAGYADQPASTTYYSSESGGGVFDSGSTYWPCLSMGSCSDLVLPAAERATLWGVLRAVVVGFQTPGFGRIHPSEPSAIPSETTLRGSLPRAAVGTYGPGD